MSKTAIIFGVTGQDGSYLSEYLLGLDYRVVGVTRRCSVDNTINIKGVLSHPHFLLLEGDVADYISVSGTFKQAKSFFGGVEPREVYNLAAQSHVGLSFSQPVAAFRNNAEGPLNILTVIHTEGQPNCTRFYQASTSEMFGSNYVEAQGWGGPRKIQNEETPFTPNSPYAIAKVAAHHTVRMFREAYGMYACAGILFNHESPRRGEKFVTRRIAKYVASLHASCTLDFPSGLGKPFPKLKLGNLDAYRDWGYAPDYVRAMHMMLNREQPEDFVIGTGETHTVRDFCAAAFSCVGISDWEQFVEVDQEYIRPLDVDYLCASTHKANTILGWESQVTFNELVEIMVKAELR